MDNERRVRCATCGGWLKPWRSGWMHVEHTDWKTPRPHDPSPDDELLNDERFVEDYEYRSADPESGL